MALKKIVVGVDGSPAALRATTWAADRAIESGAEVIAVTAIDVDMQFVRDLPPSGMSAWRTELHEQLRTEWAEPLKAAGVRHRTVIVETPPATAILQVADDEDADLIVIGTHGHGSIRDRLLGSISYRVTHLARQPVTIIPPDWRSEVA
ncbi:MAG: universal stress protein [Acidimicrobiales bacterium]